MSKQIKVWGETRHVFDIGGVYRTRGGWLAKVIWRDRENPTVCGGFIQYAIHRPGDWRKDVGPVAHDQYGEVCLPQGVALPPTFEGHPADLLPGLLEDGLKLWGPGLPERWEEEPVVEGG